MNCVTDVLITSPKKMSIEMNRLPKNYAAVGVKRSVTVKLIVNWSNIDILIGIWIDDDRNFKFWMMMWQSTEHTWIRITDRSMETDRIPFEISFNQLVKDTDTNKNSKNVSSRKFTRTLDLKSVQSLQLPNVMAIMMTLAICQKNIAWCFLAMIQSTL